MIEIKKEKQIYHCLNMVYISYLSTHCTFIYRYSGFSEIYNGSYKIGKAPPSPWTLALLILGDPGAVSRVGRKGGTKVFKYGQKSPWIPTLTELFPKIQADAGS